MRIIFVTPYVPSRVRVRPYYWIRQLTARGHDVRLFTVVSDARDETALPEMRDCCSSVTAARLPAWRPVWNALRALGRREPLQLWYAWNRRLAGELMRAVIADPPDVAHIEHLRAACFKSALAGIPTVFDAVDSIALLFEQARRAAPGWRMRWASAIDAGPTRRFERTAVRRFDRVVVSSPIDAARFRDSRGSRAQGSRVSVIPNPVDLDYFSPDGGTFDPSSVVFTGKMSYHANVAAALDLIERVMPGVWRLRPDARVTIVGQAPPPSLLRLRSDRVTVTGTVDDIRVHLRRAAVAVCPMRYGAGIQNKVLEAMACRVPVVASTLACTALEAQRGEDLLVADSHAAMAVEIARVLGDGALRDRLGARGRAYAAAHHEGGMLAARLERIYAESV